MNPLDALCVQLRIQRHSQGHNRVLGREAPATRKSLIALVMTSSKLILKPWLVDSVLIEYAASQRDWGMKTDRRWVYSLFGGYAVWQLAKFQRRATVPCIIRHMSEEEALLHLIEKNRGSKGINDFVRILLALELEPWFRTRAKSDQRISVKAKGSSQLTTK